MLRAVFYFVLTLGATSQSKALTCPDVLKAELSLIEKSEALNLLEVNSILTQTELLDFEYKVNHWIKYTSKILTDKSDSYVVNAYLSVREKLYDTLTKVSENSALNYNLNHIELILSALSNFTSPGYSKEVREYYLQLMSNKNFTSAIIEIGRTSKSINHSNVLYKFKDTLTQLHFILNSLNDRIGATILEEVATAFYFAVQNQTQDHQHVYLGPQIDWNIDKISSIIQKYRAALLRDDFPEEVKSIFQHFDVETRENIQMNMSVFKNKRSFEILKSLSASRRFKVLASTNISSIFFILNYCSFKAENAHSQMQKDLLNNTVSFILSKEIPIFMWDTGNANGLAGKDYIALNRKEHSNKTFGAVSPSSIDLALQTLPHEVSHLISGIGVSQSVTYFEEEYRAWMVGFIGLNGRKPTQREAASRSLDLMMYADNGGYLYPDIHQAWKESPTSFYPYLSAMGFIDPSSLRTMSYQQLVDEVATISHEEEAPLWGQNGFLTNNFSGGVSRFSDKQIIIDGVIYSFKTNVREEDYTIIEGAIKTNFGNTYQGAIIGPAYGGFEGLVGIYAPASPVSENSE